MIDRNKFKRLVPDSYTSQWFTGEDVPISWKKKELKKMEKKTIRTNYKKCSISFSLYKRLMRTWRNKWK